MGLLNFESEFSVSVAKGFYSVIVEEHHIPNLFIRTAADVTSVNTRNAEMQNLYIRSVSLHFCQNSILFRGLKMWNDIPFNIRKLVLTARLLCVLGSFY